MFAPSRGNSKSTANFWSAEPYGSGHINDTYCAVFDQGGARVRYILQRINHNIFKNPRGAHGKHPARHGASGRQSLPANPIRAAAC